MAQIKNRFNETIMHESKKKTLKQLCEIHKKMLKEAYLRGVNLTRANLAGAELRRVNLYGADLKWANLKEANLKEANLEGADLRWANLEGANLEGANLKGANLKGANGLISIGPIGNMLRCIYAVRNDKKITIQAGCFWGTIDEFKKAVDKKYKGNSLYYKAIELLKAWEKGNE